MRSAGLIVSFHLNFLMGIATAVTFPLKKGNSDTERTPFLTYFALSFDVNEAVGRDDFVS